MGDELSPTEEFFFNNAGYCWKPGEETQEQGRTKTAIMLAFAESTAKLAGATYQWLEDWSVDHQKEFDCYTSGPPSTCEMCCIYVGDDPIPLHSLGCIDDATPEYRRVIEAEMALEVIEHLPIPLPGLSIE